MLNRLEPGSDISEDGGRGLLQETLDVYANTLRSLREELTKVREQELIVAPVPIEEFPTNMGLVPASPGLQIGTIVFSAIDQSPAGYRTCDGTSGTPDLRGRVPMGSGVGAGLSLRNVGDSGGAETSAALNAHTHDLGNHTHTGPSHTHDMGNHVHANGDHTHPMGFHLVGAGGSITGAFASTALDGGSAGYSTSGMNSTPVNTSAPSTNTTGSGGTGASGTPSSNTSGSAGSGSSFSIMPPFKVLKALYKDSPGALDSNRVCPIQFGRVPSLFTLDGPASITNMSAADDYEVVAAGLAPEKIVTITSSLGSGAGNSTVAVLRFSVYVPYNFRRWQPKAIQIRTKLSMTGCSGGTSATITLKARKPSSTTAYLPLTNTRTLNVSAGNIADSAWADMVLRYTDLEKDWQPGYCLACEVVWSIPLTFTTAVLKVGRLKINW